MLEGSRDHVYQAALLDPNTAATLTTTQVVAMCDELLEAHAALLPAAWPADRRPHAQAPRALAAGPSTPVRAPSATAVLGSGAMRGKIPRVCVIRTAAFAIRLAWPVTQTAASRSGARPARAVVASSSSAPRRTISSGSSAGRPGCRAGRRT